MAVVRSTPAASSVGSPRGSPAGGHPRTAEPRFVGASSSLRNALQQLDRFAPFDHTHVLIEGESGTGKSFAARHLHLASPRAGRVFHQVVLSTLDDNLAASDLFGHLSGSYTDARQSRPGHWVTANGGTLFLDEIGKASPAVQRKLLHAVEHHEVWPVGADRGVRLDVRLVAATNIPLEQLVREGTFLPDLAARLAAFRVRLPSLGERREDIPALVEQFVELRAAQCGHPGGAPAIAPEVMRALQSADWPNNLRELDSVVQRLLIEAAGEPRVNLSHCAGQLQQQVGAARSTPRITPAVVQERLAEMEGSVGAAARSLGVSRWTIYRHSKRRDHDGRDEHSPSE